MVSAVMVVLVSVGVLKTSTPPSAAPATRSSARWPPDLAQQDQERLRAYRAQELNNYIETRCVLKPDTGGFIDDPQCDDNPANGSKYKIVSRTDWVSDTSGTRSLRDRRPRRLHPHQLDRDLDRPRRRRAAARGVCRMASIVAPRVGSFGERGQPVDRDPRPQRGTGARTCRSASPGRRPSAARPTRTAASSSATCRAGNYTVNVNQAGYDRRERQHRTSRASSA